MSPKNIFIVDDDEMMAMMLSDHLKKNPANNVTIFNTGEDCLKSLHQNPDLIILDFQLNSVVPDAGDGLQILQQIKKLDQSINVIMLSSQSQYSKAMQTIAKGAIQYVIKDDDAFKQIEAILKDI